MFQHIVYSLANRQGLFAYVRTCKTRLDTTTKFMVVTLLFNIVSSSFPDNMTYMNMTVDLSWWFQQRCSSLFVHQAMNSLFQHAASTSLSATMFKLASSTMFKPVNMQKQAVRFDVFTCVFLRFYINKLDAIKHPWTFLLTFIFILVYTDSFTW